MGVDGQKTKKRVAKGGYYRTQRVKKWMGSIENSEKERSRVGAKEYKGDE